MTTQTSIEFESYVPVYDTVPESWEEARTFLIEVLKKISTAVNTRTIGWLLDEELLSGQAFVPGVTIPGNNPGQFRQVLRKVVDVSPLAIGANTVAHGIIFDVNFTLIDIWVAATNSTTFMAVNIADQTDLVMDATNLVITSSAVYDRAWCVIEYCQEL